jgi:Bifunctional DNA primase/polymerase, N-terminal
MDRIEMTAAAETAAALAAALSLGIPAFPCRPDKSPACPHGWRDATADPVALRELWRHHPSQLVGVPMGGASGLDALDIDAPRHPEAAGWWQGHHGRLPPTRIHRTRSGGLHVLFRHAAGLRCSVGRITPGIDVRADGGYIIWWPAAGEPMLCDAPLAPWPQWLLDELTPRPTPRGGALSTPPSDCRAGSRYAGAALRSAIERVARTPVGGRNDALNREAYGLGRLVAAGLIDVQHIADALAAAAIAGGLTPRETEATLRSALGARGLL